MYEITLFSRSEILSYVCDIHLRRLLVLQWFKATRFSQILTSVSHLGWPSRAMHLGDLGLIRTSP